MLPARRAAVLLAVTAIAVVVVHGELRSRAEAAELRTLTQEVASLRSRLAAERPADATAAPALVPRSCALDSDALQSIANVVGATLARSPAAQAARSKEAEPPAPRSLEAEQSVAHAESLLAAALRQRRLARADVVQMRADLLAGQATPEEMDDVRRRIAQAINAQQLVPEDPRAVFP